MRLKAIAACACLTVITVGVKAQNTIQQNDNIIAFSPIVLNESGYGSGLSWERFLVKKKWLSCILPFSVTVNTNEYNRGNMFYFTPGVKVYTNMNSYRRAKFSVGPTLLVAAGKGSTIRDNFQYYGFERERSHFMYGFMVNAGYNIFPLPQIYFGADIGLGLTSVNKYNGYHWEPVMLRSLSLKLGYMFSTRAKAAPSNGDNSESAAN